MTQVMEVTEEAWKEWRHSLVTQEFRRFLAKAQQAVMEQWAAKAFMGETRDEVLILNAAALGKIEAYKELIDLDYEQFKGVMYDEQDEQIRPAS